MKCFQNRSTQGKSLCVFTLARDLLAAIRRRQGLSTMGRISKLSFLRPGRRTGNEATANGYLSSQSSTSKSNNSPSGTNGDGDDSGAQLSSPTSTNIQTLASRSPLSPRNQHSESYARPANRMSQSEVHLPRPDIYSDHFPSLDILDGVIDQCWNDHGPSDKLRRMHCQGSASTLESKHDTNLYQSTIAQYRQSPSPQRRNLRGGLSYASTPNLRASCLVPENEEQVPELPSFDNSKPVKPGKTGLRRLMSKTLGNPPEAMAPVRRISEMPPEAYLSEPRQCRASGWKTRHPSIMRLPSHETFFKSKPKPSELQQTNLNHHYQHPDPFKSAKIHIRKPRPGTRHWFDAFDSDDDNFDHGNDPHIRSESPLDRISAERKGSQSSYAQPMPSPLSVPSSSRTNKEELKFGNRKEFVNHSSSERKDSLSMDEAATPSGNAFANARRGQSNRVMSLQPGESKFYGSNLLNQSILSLSSDDDDDDSMLYKDSPDGGTEIRNRRYETSHQKGTEALEGKGRTSLSRKISSSRYRNNSSAPMNDGAAKIESQSDLRKRSTGRSSLLSLSQGDCTKSRSHMRQYSLIEEEEGNNEGTSGKVTGADRPDQPWLSSPTTRAASQFGTDEGSGPKSEVDTSASEVKSATTEPATHAQHRKLIEVTEDEEALLQLMRSKRAITPKRSFTDGYIRSLDAEKKDQNTRPRRKKEPGAEKPRTSAFLALDSPMGSIFPKPPSFRHSSQAPPLPKLPNNMTRALPRVGHGPPTEFPKRTSSITSNTSPFTLTRHRSFDTLHYIPHTESLPGSTTASTIMPSDSVSAYGYASPSNPLHLPPLPDLSSIPSQLALSQALGYDSNDMFPSPTTAPISSPSTPVFQSTAASSATDVEVVGHGSGITADILPPNTGRPRRETTSSSGIMLDKDDAFSTITAGSKSIVEITRLNKTGAPVRRSRQVSDPAKDVSRPSSSKSSLPYGRTSIGDDVLSAWKALGGMRNVEQMPIGNYA